MLKAGSKLCRSPQRLKETQNLQYSRYSFDEWTRSLSSRTISTAQPAVARSGTSVRSRSTLIVVQIVVLIQAHNASRLLFLQVEARDLSRIYPRIHTSPSSKHYLLIDRKLAIWHEETLLMISEVSPRVRENIDLCSSIFSTSSL